MFCTHESLTCGKCNARFRLSNDRSDVMAIYCFEDWSWPWVTFGSMTFHHQGWADERAWWPGKRKVCQLSEIAREICGQIIFWECTLEIVWLYWKMVFCVRFLVVLADVFRHPRSTLRRLSPCSYSNNWIDFPIPTLTTKCNYCHNQ